MQASGRLAVSSSACGRDTDPYPLSRRVGVGLHLPAGKTQTRTHTAALAHTRPEDPPSKGEAPAASAREAYELRRRVRARKTKSGGISTLQSRAPGLQSTTEGDSIWTKDSSESKNKKIVIRGLPKYCPPRFSYALVCKRVSYI